VCVSELVPFPRPCCYVHKSKVKQHIGVENNVAEAAATLDENSPGLNCLTKVRERKPHLN
jgi:hypothetical protein